MGGSPGFFPSRCLDLCHKRFRDIFSRVLVRKILPAARVGAWRPDLLFTSSFHIPSDEKHDTRETGSACIKNIVFRKAFAIRAHSRQLFRTAES